MALTPTVTDAGLAPPHDRPAPPTRVALLGNPNTGKTTLFNRLSGLRHKTSNFPGTTQEARLGFFEVDAATIELIDLPGVYSLELDQAEAEIARCVLAGELAPRGEPIGPPDAVCIVLDSTNLPRGFMLLGEALRRRLPSVVALNMFDLAERNGLEIDAAALASTLGCPVVPCSARSGRGLEALRTALASAAVPIVTPPGDDDALARWAEHTSGRVLRSRLTATRDVFTDRADRLLTHPAMGTIIFTGVMAALFWSIFSLAAYPMEWIESLFGLLGDGARALVPEGILRDFLADGIVAGIAGVLVFLPQICLLFFLISLLEDTGYLARAAFVMDRVMRPFGLPGHSFVPLLSSHACALPGIMAARAVPDRRERLATILVAPFVTCSARLPVYVLLTGLLFPHQPMRASLAFVGAYALGIIAAMGSALLARRTILRGPVRPMALELPTYKRPSIRSALLTTYDRGVIFLKQAGTNILAICIVLWWLSAFPHVDPPAEAIAMREQAAQVEPARADELRAEADRLEAAHASAESFIGRIGRSVQPVFAPLGYDWQLTVGVMASFAAREVFVSTMAVVVAGESDAESDGVIERISGAKRSDGVTPLFTPAVCWSLLVYYVLAMQCLPTLAVTAREAGGVKWAILQLAWMSAVAYAAALIAYRAALWLGVN